MDFEIVKIPFSSWPEYKALRLMAVKNDPQAFSISYEKESAYPDEKWQQRLQAVIGGKSWLIFAKADNKLVGMIGGFQNEENKLNHLVEIHGTFVDPDFRGRGIAKALMAAILEEFSKTPEIKTVRLEVNVEQNNAKKLYENFGFKEISSSNLVLGDNKEHLVAMMEKNLQCQS